MTVPVIKSASETQKPEQIDLELLFTNLRIRSWQTLRLLLQRRANVFAYSPDKESAVAGFIITPDNMRKVLDIYLRVYNWKSVIVKIKGSTIDTATEGNKWIHCWIQAHANTDEWCLNKDFDPQLYTGITGWYDYLNKPHTWIEDRLTLPCKNVRWRPDTTRPGDYKSQYAKACRTQGCDRCPFFNINRFRQYVINTDPSQQIESKNK